ncbi:manganese-binding transcriptional regulator MntR [Paracoccus luteus]|uniref:manganese-binding transcriptional regulator MntR n=1 Tax=Paracoccus luteus TaxID=2508543 RepID=UPI0015F2B1C1|nr:manganese-binding transcriptional regulator MntR [Paracoccus luteus]
MTRPRPDPDPTLPAAAVTPPVAEAEAQPATQPAAGVTPPAAQPGAQPTPQSAAGVTGQPAAPSPAPSPPVPQPDRHERARQAQAQALLEDYTELIDDLIAATGEARITDIAAHLGVTHPTATKTVARLRREGLAQSRPYRGVFLTDSGRDMAARARARHRMVVDVLLALGVPSDAAETDAEGIEHHVSDSTLAAFGRFLDGRG